MCEQRWHQNECRECGRQEHKEQRRRTELKVERKKKQP